MAKRNSYSASYKAKVALEALRSERTIAELAAKYELHPQLITKWKRQAAEGLVGVFSGEGCPGKDTAAYEAQIKELHAKMLQAHD